MNPLIQNNSRISDKVVEILELRILEGSLKPGDTLPSERDLAMTLGVSRPSLREAIRALVSKGMLQTKHGGRTRVTDKLDSSFADNWQEMLFKHPNIQADMLEFRDMLEGQAAYYAAQRATDIDMLNLEVAYKKVSMAYDTHELRQMVDADVAFHQAVAEASHNVLIGHLSATLLRLIDQHVTQSLNYLNTRPKNRSQLEDQHQAIWLAIKSRNPEEAMKASKTHIEFVKANMKASAEEQDRIESSLRRKL